MEQHSNSGCGWMKNISNWSLWMDFYIMMKTAWVVLGGNGR